MPVDPVVWLAEHRRLGKMIDQTRVFRVSPGGIAELLLDVASGGRGIVDDVPDSELRTPDSEPLPPSRWDKKFLELAVLVSSWSKDGSTKIGCVIAGPDNEVRSLGYNGMPRGIDDDVPARHERPLKYKWFEHAERNAIYNAARCGVQLKGCRIYLLSLACADCARAIIQSGISEVITTPPEFDNPRWGDDLRLAMQMFDEADVLVKVVNFNAGTVLGKT